VDKQDDEKARGRYRTGNQAEDGRGCRLIGTGAGWGSMPQPVLGPRKKRSKW
jgi:hypothetical protein